MLTKDLDYQFPSQLIATERKTHSRVMWVEKGRPREISTSACLNELSPNDILIINDTKVIPARVFSQEGLEILFVAPTTDLEWTVLCNAKRWPKDTKQTLPTGIEVELVAKGLPQTVRTSAPLTTEYFNEYGDMPLPPYIQEQRGQRESRASDRLMYQPAWAEKYGSLASPTASLHFSKDDLLRLKSRGVEVETITLHVGLGTFLPVKVEHLADHKMHGEVVEIPHGTVAAMAQVKARGGRVWALGSTVTRALESQALGLLAEGPHGYGGSTTLFIKPEFNFQIVDVLMTNFHQPQSTLLAMVMAFAGVDQVRQCYQWAIEKQFRLFSYGDLSVWVK